MPLLKEKPENDPGKRLESWKEIAAYLNCGERTAKRWEKTRNLPVRRLPGGKGQVFAYRAEVVAWRESNSLASLPADESEPELSPPDQNSLPSSDTADPHPLAVADRSFPSPFRRGALVAAGLVLAIAVLVIYGGRLRRAGATPASGTTAIGHIPPQKARDLYLEGRFYWNKRTPADLKLAMADFQQAIALDHDYAQAYAGMADAYGLSTEFAAMAPQQAYPRMLDAAQRAISLDPNLATGHRALGFALFYWDWDLSGSRREFERSLALDPQNATTYQWFGNVLQQGGEPARALQMMDKARELDPTSRSILADRGLILVRLGRGAEANQVWTQLENSDPSYPSPHWYKANRALANHDVPGFLRELRAIANITHSATDADRVRRCEQGLKAGGTSGLLNAEADFEAEKAQRARFGYFVAAEALDHAGRDQDALRYLEMAYTQRDPEFPLLGHMDDFTRLRNDPRFVQLKSRSQLPYTESELQFPQLR